MQERSRRARPGGRALDRACHSPAALRRRPQHSRRGRGVGHPQCERISHRRRRPRARPDRGHETRAGALEVAAPRGHRPADRRRRSRLQQSPDHRHRKSGAARALRRRRARPRPRSPRRQGRRRRRTPHGTAADLRAPAPSRARGRQSQRPGARDDRASAEDARRVHPPHDQSRPQLVDHARRSERDRERHSQPRHQCPRRHARWRPPRHRNEQRHIRRSQCRPRCGPHPRRLRASLRVRQRRRHDARRS